jgi:hypothetical protein
MALDAGHRNADGERKGSGSSLPALILGLAVALAVLVVVGGCCWSVYLVLAISSSGLSTNEWLVSDIAFVGAIAFTLGFFIMTWWAAYRLLRGRTSPE